MSAKEADIVIIGGGTAGLVLAARLSEDPTIHVLVLEAGGNQLDDPRVTTPGLWPSLLKTDLDWSYLTVPQVSPARRSRSAVANTGLERLAWEENS